MSLVAGLTSRRPGRVISRITALTLTLTMALSGCIFIDTRRASIASLDAQTPTEVTSPVKVHLKDGSTVTFPHGVTVSATEVRGAGTRHDLTLAAVAFVESVPLDEVAAMEAYRLTGSVEENVTLSVLANVGAFVLFKALFGSCPTVYSAGGQVEEAELFSSSIAPLFEARDLDLLKARPDETGLVSLEIRNEAMETHYLNHLQLFEVRHAADETSFPDPQGAVLALRGTSPVAAAVSRSGRDVAPLLASADGLAYSTERTRIDQATDADMDDWIDVTVPVPAGATSTTLALRMRNSLLNTVLLYDVMLGPSGAAALNWLAGDLANISTAVELGRWHQQRAGLHVSVWEDGHYREVVRVPDAGPISWHDIAAVVPVPAGATSVKLRLAFVVDHWRIDRLAVATSFRTPEVRVIPLSQVRGATGKPETDALANMSAPDSRYLQTNPGQYFVAEFETGPAPSRDTRTVLLSSQGYYTEWIRGDWVRAARSAETFKPGDHAILAALRRWSGEREAFEQRFFLSRVPVRAGGLP